MHFPEQWKVFHVPTTAMGMAIEEKLSITKEMYIMKQQFNLFLNLTLQH